MRPLSVPCFGVSLSTSGSGNSTIFLGDTLAYVTEPTDLTQSLISVTILIQYKYVHTPFLPAISFSFINPLSSPSVHTFRSHDEHSSNFRMSFLWLEPNVSILGLVELVLKPTCHNSRHLRENHLTENPV